MSETTNPQDLECVRGTIYGIWSVVSRSWMTDKEGMVFHTTIRALAEGQAYASNRIGDVWRVRSFDEWWREQERERDVGEGEL